MSVCTAVLSCEVDGDLLSLPSRSDRHRCSFSLLLDSFPQLSRHFASVATNQHLLLIPFPVVDQISKPVKTGWTLGGDLQQLWSLILARDLTIVIFLLSCLSFSFQKCRLILNWCFFNSHQSLHLQFVHRCFWHVCKVFVDSWRCWSSFHFKLFQSDCTNVLAWTHEHYFIFQLFNRICSAS